MYSDQQAVIAGFRNLYQTNFRTLLEQRIESIHSLYNSFLTFNSQYLSQLRKVKNQDGERLLILHRQYIDHIIQLNRDSYKLEETSALGEALDLFVTSCDDFISQIPVYITSYEESKNRVIQEGDSFLCKAVKRLKCGRYKVFSWFRKKDNPPRFKKRIPFRNFHVYLLLLEISDGLMEFVTHFLEFELDQLTLKKLCVAEIDELFNIREQTDYTLIQSRLEAFQAAIKKTSHQCQTLQSGIPDQIDQLLQPFIEQALNNYYKQGSFEGRSRYIRNRYIRKKRRQKQETFRKRLRAWEINLFSLSEDWSFDADLFRIKNRCLLSWYNLGKSKAQNRHESVQKWFVQAKERVSTSRDVLVNSIDYLEQIDHQRQFLSELLKEEGNSLTKIPQDETLLHQISSIENKVEAEVSAIQEKRMIVKGHPQNNLMSMNDLTPVYLRELLQFEIVPAFKVKLDQIRKRSAEAIIGYDNNLNNLSHVSDYNLDTVRMILESDDEDRIDKAREILEEGLLQFVNKLDQLSEHLLKTYSTVTEETHQALRIFVDQLIALTENERVGELRMRLLKAKALKKSELIWLNTVSFYRSGMQYLRPIWLKVVKRGSHLTEQLSQIYGEGESQTQISTDISNFLAETKTNLQRMPFLYQRLFQLEPIDEGYLFFERQSELKKIHKSYQDWEMGRFSAAAMVAEKGAGMTTLIHYFTKNLMHSQYRIDLSAGFQIYRIDDFLQVLSDRFNQRGLTTKELVVSFLNGLPHKTIIVLEGLQYLYLKKVDGFDCLKLLFEIISHTNKKVFWICTCTQHAWNYLNKVLSIGEYFAYVVPLEEFDNDEMIDIVQKRHNVSGYGLQFLPGKSDLNNRKLMRLPDEQRQMLLQRQYFTQLNQLAKGNLSVAFIFWMRSLQKIEDNILFVNSMSGFKGDFIQALAREKLFCLHALLIHDGLDADDFCKVMRYLPDAGYMKLFQMVDDGLLLKIDERYVINLLLYRPIINALKAHNLLH